MVNKRLLKFLLLIFVLLFIETGNVHAAQNTCLFFYGNGCPHCAKVEPFIDGLGQKYPDLEIRKFEIYGDRQNAVLLNNYFDTYHVPDSQRGVPVVFISNKYLVGDKPILENLEKEIITINETKPPKLEEKKEMAAASMALATENLKALSLATVIGAAIVDSINPCAFAVLLILLGVLLASGDKKKALKAGFAFTISIYIVYFLFGLGLFSALQISGLSFWFYKIIGILAIIIGLANIKDYFRYGAGGFVMEIPRKWRPTLKNLLSKATSPISAFLMGFLVCLFELPCTGGPYIFILGLLAEKTTRLAAIPVLLLYNLFFVLPLVIIILLIYVGLTNIEKATEWKERNIKLLHLIAGIIMLILGIIVILKLV